MRVPPDVDVTWDSFYLFIMHRTNAYNMKNASQNECFTDTYKNSSNTDFAFNTANLLNFCIFFC